MQVIQTTVFAFKNSRMELLGFISSNDNAVGILLTSLKFEQISLTPAEKLSALALLNFENQSSETVQLTFEKVILEIIHEDTLGTIV
jgi:hypothetical protein